MKVPTWAWLAGGAALAAGVGYWFATKRETASGAATRYMPPDQNVPGMHDLLPYVNVTPTSPMQTKLMTNLSNVQGRTTTAQA